MWELNKTGALVIRDWAGNTILQSGGTIPSSYINGLGMFATVGKLNTTTNPISTYIDGVACRSLLVNTAAVGTLNIGEDAVTVPVAEALSADADISNAYSDNGHINVTLDSLGQPVHLTCTVYSKPYGFEGDLLYARVLVGSTVVQNNILVNRAVAYSYSESDYIGYRLTTTFCALISGTDMGSGDKVVKVQFMCTNSSDYVVGQRTLLCLGVKR